MTADERNRLRALVDQARRARLAAGRRTHTYRDGCRCDQCKAEHRDYQRHWYRQGANAEKKRAAVRRYRQERRAA